MIITDLRTYHVYGSREDQISPFFLICRLFTPALPILEVFKQLVPI